MDNIEIKKRGRPRVLDDCQRKLHKQQRAKQIDARRIYLGSESAKQWIDMKSRLGVTDIWLINHLLGVHDKHCTCRSTGSAHTANPITSSGVSAGSSTTSSSVPSVCLQPESVGPGKSTVSNPSSLESDAAPTLIPPQVIDAPTPKEEPLENPQGLEASSQQPGAFQGSRSTPPDCTDSSPNPTPSSPVDSSWKFVHFPMSWNYGDRISNGLTFNHNPSVNLMAKGLTRSSAVCPVGHETPGSERQLYMSNFLEMYFTAKMLERQGISVNCGEGMYPSPNMFVILQRWLQSFIGITAEISEVKLKAERVVQHFQTLESNYNQNLNEQNFERLGDFLLSSWSSFALTESERMSLQPTSNSQPSQPGDATGSALAGAVVQGSGNSDEPKYWVYRANHDEDMETDAADDTAEQKDQPGSSRDTPEESFQIKEEPDDAEDAEPTDIPQPSTSGSESVVVHWHKDGSHEVRDGKHSNQSVDQSAVVQDYTKQVQDITQDRHSGTDQESHVQPVAGQLIHHRPSSSVQDKSDEHLDDSKSDQEDADNPVPVPSPGKDKTST